MSEIDWFDSAEAVMIVSMLIRNNWAIKTHLSDLHVHLKESIRLVKYFVPFRMEPSSLQPFP